MYSYDLASVARWQPYNLHCVGHVHVPRLDQYDTDPAQHLITACWDLDDDLDGVSDLSDLSDDFQHWPLLGREEIGLSFRARAATRGRAVP